MTRGALIGQMRRRRLDIEGVVVVSGSLVERSEREVDDSSVS